VLGQGFEPWSSAIFQSSRVLQLPKGRYDWPDYTNRAHSMLGTCR
jgi:hypothetical protein